MVSAQTDLRRLVDRDPLTGLANRRALPEVFRSVQPEGALLIFFDLNDFKQINDEHGHQAGDECLTRFATALTQCFRPNDAVVRYGGDEFLVVATGVSETAAYERTDAVRSRVGVGSGGALPIRFLGGHEPPRRPAAILTRRLREADEAMYRAKRKSAQRPRAAPRRCRSSRWADGGYTGIHGFAAGRAKQRRFERFRFQRLADVVVHAGREAGLAIFIVGIGGQGHDARPPVARVLGDDLRASRRRHRAPASAGP